MRSKSTPDVSSKDERRGFTPTVVLHDVRFTKIRSFDIDGLESHAARVQLEAFLTRCGYLSEITVVLKLFQNAFINPAISVT